MSSIQDVIEEVLEAAPDGKQVPPLRHFQAEVKRKLGFEPGLDTIRRILNALGWYPEAKQSHRWAYRHKREEGEQW